MADALEAMDAQDVDALPVVDGERVGVVTRGVLRRFLEQPAPPSRPEPAFAPTEMKA